VALDLLRVVGELDRVAGTVGVEGAEEVEVRVLPGPRRARGEGQQHREEYTKRYTLR